MTAERKQKKNADQKEPCDEQTGKRKKPSPEEEERKRLDEAIDEAGRESFPASDPPAYSPRK